MSAALLCASSLVDLAPAAESNATAIRVNQLGYLPASRKLALVENPAGRGFAVVDERKGNVVLRGELQPPATWAPAQVFAAVADLSAVSRPGTYRIVLDDSTRSDGFSISANAYGALGDAALKGFYFMRSGTALEAAHAGPYARAAGHPDTSVEVHASAASPARPAGTLIASPRGWYDAGDYNKYVVNSGITTYTLLAALEHFPAWFRSRSSGIPESGDAVPDILDEVRWNLQWMLTMQDPDDGGVYHKLTTLKFDGPMMPERDAAKRYVVQKTTAATLDFAAVMAVASRIHANHEKQFPGAALRMREAAKAAWQWALANPSIAYRQPADVATGAYGDRSFNDEFAWAAAELFLLTGDASYLREFRQHEGSPGVPSWSDVGALAWSSLAQHRARLPVAERRHVEQQIDALAAKLTAQWRDSPWKVAMQPADFVWGSNAVVMNQALMLLQGYRISNKRDYLDAAQSQLDYVLGRNPLGVSFVTGQGRRTPLHIHHRPSQADGIEAPVPGLLSGGPNPGQQDAKDCGTQYASKLPALS